MNAIDPAFRQYARFSVREPPPQAEAGAVTKGKAATRIYRLVPKAPPDDTGWGGALYHGEIVVRARSSGEARAVAARAEAIAAGEAMRTTTQVTASALREPRLYSVRLDESSRFPDEGPVELLAGTFRFPDRLVLHGD